MSHTAGHSAVIMGGMVTVFNPGRVPVLLDSEGRTLGAGDWDQADPSDPQTDHALKQKQIVIVEGAGK